MEIFLLLVVIILMIIFHSTKNSRLGVLEKKLSNIENYLKSIQLTQLQKSAAAKTESQEEISRKVVPPVVPPITPPIVPPPVVPPKEEEKPIIVKEKFIPPVKLAETKPVEKAETVPLPVKPPVPKVYVHEDTWYDNFRKNNPDLEKFIGENILSKVAITVLVIGVAFFVKYAIDQNWINEVARVGIGIMCGGIVLGFAHRLHKKFKAFSSVLVAGGISIFYFTIGIAFHEYKLFDQTTAFIIMFLITGFSVFISIAYDRVELAALSIVGGFATPFMVSTGQGNYQMLFTYVLILDVGMLVLAYLRKWNLVNILTYFFSMLLYLSWLETKVIGDPRGAYNGAILFGAVFYVLFIIMNIINNIKEKRKFGTLELSILLSNTFLFYGAGMQILNYYHPELRGLFSACMAVFNLICSWLLYKKFKADEKLVYMMIGLTLTFITISAPVQLHGNYITLFWALEAVLLMWLAQKSNIVLYRFTSVVITFLTFLSLFMDWAVVYSSFNEEGITQQILFNKGFITGLVSAFSAGAIVMLLKKEALNMGTELPTFATITFHAKNYSSFLKVAFVALIYFSGLFELVYQLRERTDAKVAFYIIVNTYHLGFLSVLNLVLLRYKDNYLNPTLYFLNTLSVTVFVIGFALLPVFDFKENIIKTEMNYTGFLFHYLALAAALFLVFKLVELMKQKAGPAGQNSVFYSTVIAAVIVYLSSIELILHVSQFTIANVTDTSYETVIQKLTQYRQTSIHVFKIGFPILWGLLAFAFLFFGMKRHNKTFRISGLILIALILLKLFTYDIKDASEAGKIIAFIILGIVLLIISFMYQKIKALLVDDTKKKTAEKDIN